MTRLMITWSVLSVTVLINPIICRLIHWSSPQDQLKDENYEVYAKFNDFWETVRIRMARFTELAKKSNFERQMIENEVEELKSKVKKLQDDYFTIFRRDSNSVQKTGTFYDLDGIPHPSEIVLVLDEARSLLEGPESQNYFHCLRSAHREWGFRAFVLIFVDTVSTILSFPPPFSHDSSARPTRTFDLLPAFYQVTTYNSCAQMSVDPEDRIDQLIELFSKGRPLWSACYFQRPQFRAMIDIHHAIKFAMKKLANMEAPILESSFFGALACLCIRFGIWGVLDHSYASTLLSSHMATALHFGDDRLRMFTHYVPEPILSEAACQLIYSTGSDISNCPRGTEHASKLVKVFEDFELCVISGLVDAGSIGELVGRIVLSLAYDSLHIDDIEHSMESEGTAVTDHVLFSDAVALKEFLDVLLPEHNRDRYKGIFGVDCFDENHEACKTLIGSGQVAFTTFEMVDSNSELDISQEFLSNAYDHRFAYIGLRNQASCDLIIPVRYVRDSCTLYTALVVQVKNYEETRSSQTGRFTDAGEKLFPASCTSR